MREIKFRAFADSNEMRYDITGFECSAGGELVGVFIDGDYFVCDCTPDNCISRKMHPSAHLMQFTGLTDKNGVEIYEGDILSEPVSPVGGKDGGYLYKARAIEWLGAGRGYALFAPYAASEVIGNIHQTPELVNA